MHFMKKNKFLFLLITNLFIFLLFNKFIKNQYYFIKNQVKLVFKINV